MKRKFVKKPITASSTLDNHVLDILEATKPEDTDYISYSYEWDSVELDLVAEGKPRINDCDPDGLDHLDWLAIETLESWATELAKRLADLPDVRLLAEALEFNIGTDWYSGMSLEDHGGPFTYGNIVYTAYNEE